MVSVSLWVRKTMARASNGCEGRGAVNIAVEDDPNRTVFVAHRLTSPAMSRRASRRCPRATPAAGGPPSRRICTWSCGPRWRGRRSCPGAFRAPGPWPDQSKPPRDGRMEWDSWKLGAGKSRDSVAGTGRRRRACGSAVMLPPPIRRLTPPARPPPSTLIPAVMRYTSSHTRLVGFGPGDAAAPGCQPGVSYSRRLFGPSLTRLRTANEGMKFGSSTPGVASWAIAPTYAPVFKSVPMQVFTWSPTRAPALSSRCRSPCGRPRRP